MVSIFVSISASLQRACGAHHVTKKQQRSPPQRAVTLGVECQSCFIPSEQPETQHALRMNRANDTEDRFNPPGPKCSDERWKKGTWDFNMFVKNGRVDWDGVIVAEAKRRKFLEMYPEASTNQEPVLFRSSIVPWWAWLKRSYPPEVELPNGRTAMVGFFMSYVVDALTVLDVVG